MRPLLLLLLYALGTGRVPAKEKPPTTYSIPLPPRADFSSLEWLVGEWVGKTTGRSPQGEIHLSVEYALDKRFMIFREEITLAPTKSASATRESWIGVLSGGGADAGFLLRTYSNTGFIINYRVSMEGPEVHFSPEGGEQPPPGWLFRRTARRSESGDLNETVQMAPPNKPFFDYYTATLSRAGPR